MISRTVILAAGDFPRKGGEARRLLEGAKRVVACDSAANAYRRHFHRWPDVILGDFDSLNFPSLPPHQAPSTRHQAPGTRHQAPGTKHKFIFLAEQETNDLAKAIRHCRACGWKKPVIVGATGRREDHTLGNIFRAMAEGIEVVTDYGRFLPFTGTLRLKVGKGTAISIFATDPKTHMTSKGLVWPLDGVRFDNLYCATLNRASSTHVTLSTRRPAFIYVSFFKGETSGCKVEMV